MIFGVMFEDSSSSSQFTADTIIMTAVTLGGPLIVCVILLILQHLRFRKSKQQTGQLFSKLSFPCERVTSIRCDFVEANA